MINLKNKHSHNYLLEDIAPDLTPMLDIIFILLVFFMLTYGSVFKSLHLNLPSSVAQSANFVSEKKHVMLEVNQNAFALNGTKIADFNILKTSILELIKQNPEIEFIVASDKQVEIEKLLQILTYLQSQGVISANILMKQDK